MTKADGDRWECPARHRSFLDRFRGPRSRWHRPIASESHVRRVEWPEFPGARIPSCASTCLDCHQPIVHVVGDVWGVRWADEWDDEPPPYGREIGSDRG